MTPEWLGKFDAILLDSAREAFPSLAGVDAGRVIVAETATDQRDWSKPDFLKSLRDRLLADVAQQERGRQGDDDAHGPAAYAAARARGAKAPALGSRRRARRRRSSTL